MAKKRIVTKQISRIAFGVIPPGLIKKMGVINVITPEIYDADGYPVKKGLMDPHMGVIDPGLRCKTCGGRMKTCPGHFGFITLSKPTINILFVDQLFNIMKSTCKDCGRILMSSDKVTELTGKIRIAKEEHDLDKLRNLMSGTVNSLKTVKKCQHCTAKKEPIKILKPTGFQYGTQRIWPDEIREWMEKVPDEDVTALGFDPAVFRPEWVILNLLLVPPITIRPSITLESGERSEDDLTHKLSDIVRVNQRLLENINAGAPEIIIEDLWDLLQYHVTTFFNNKVSQIPPARHRTRRPLRTLTQRLSGKEGRFRYNMAGKRVNFCARSVISPDPNININEVGVPSEVAKELTIPETVTEWNIKWLKGMLKSFPIYPTINYVFTDEGKRRKVTPDTVDLIMEEMKPGWVMERQLLEGDIVVFNRQPSLHRLSMMGHRVKIVTSKTFRINPIVCPPYNADFDGDEMNLHLPQTEEARSEAENILLLNNQIITPRYGLSVIGLDRSSLLSIFYLTKNLKLNREDASDIIIQVNSDYVLPKPIGKENGVDVWDGKQIFSLLLPDDLEFTKPGMIYKNNKVVKGDVQIKKGQLVEGVIGNKFIGHGGGYLIHKVYQKYGADATTEFINNLNRLGLSVGRKLAYTMSLHDLDIPEKQTEQIKQVLIDNDNNAKAIIQNYGKKKVIPLPGKTIFETFEAQMLKSLSSARNEVSAIVEKVVNEESTLVNSALAGAGDKILNIVLMSGFAGQQALRGERINFGFTGRTLPHFKKGDLSPKAHGFIRNGYAHGMDPIELFFNAIVGRDSLMDTAMRTPKSGYMQRRLINALQDLKVSYDGTIRDSGRSIVQFKFGGDGVDVSKSDGGKIDSDLE
jgi:DNA-directed RNA polymerase subunit A'